MKPKYPFFLVGCVLAIGMGLASAENPPTPDQQEDYQQKLFTLIDANNDGVVTEKEFAIFVLWDEFRRYDLNRDGKVSKEEYEKVSPDKSYYPKLDPSGKGYLTFESLLKSDLVAEDLHKEWKEALKTLKLDDAKVIKRSDLPDITP